MMMASVRFTVPRITTSKIFLIMNSHMLCILRSFGTSSYGRIERKKKVHGKLS